MKLNRLLPLICAGLVLAAAVCAAGCVSDDTTAVDPETAIIGTWISEGTYSAGDITFQQQYVFEEDHSGVLSAVSGSKTIKSVPVFWAYAEDEEAFMAYTPNTGDYDYLIVAGNGKTMRSEYGEQYTRR